ncbi:hypothetical protein ABVB18_19790, partial [Xanthomonas citri pv. mangiferaeindicae]
TPAWKVQTGTGEGLTDFPVPLLPEPLTQLRQRVLTVLGAAPIDGIGDFLIGRMRIGEAVVDQVIGNDG